MTSSTKLWVSWKSDPNRILRRGDMIWRRSLAGDPEHLGRGVVPDQAGIVPLEETPML